MKIINNQNLKIFSNISFLSNRTGIAGNNIKNLKIITSGIIPSKPNLD